MKSLSIEIKWALIFIVMTLAWMWGEKLVGLHSTHIDKHMYLTNLYAIPSIIIYVLALRDKKKNYYEGRMTYKQAFISGVIITAIIAVLSPVNQWVISTIITPEYFPNVIAHSLETGYHETREAAEEQFNLQNYMIQSAVGALVMGIFTTAIVAIFVRSKGKTAAAA